MKRVVFDHGFAVIENHSKSKKKSIISITWGKQETKRALPKMKNYG